MQAPTTGGVRVRKGDGETVRLSRGASLTDFADKVGVDAASLVQVLFALGEMVTATQSVNDETLQILGEELNYNIEVVSPEDEDKELLDSFNIEFGEDEGGEDRPRSRVRRSSPSWVTSTTERPSCSTRSATPTWCPRRPAASPSTSVPTRSRPRSTATNAS